MREANIVAYLPEGVTCVGMIEFKGTLIVALSCGVYRYDGEKLVPIQLQEEPAP